jgi:GNAT superfamily N-acetyltransferase
VVLDANDVYLAELKGMRILANLPRPNVPFAPEMIHGALCLWRTNGNGSHVDTIRIDPTAKSAVTDLLPGIASSPLRVRGGSIVVRTVDGGIGEDDAAMLDRLASSTRSTGYLMARSLEQVPEEPEPQLRDGHDCCARTPANVSEYLAVRRLAASIFGGGESTYDPESDFYSAPEILTYLALREGEQVTSAASVLVVDGIANVWSVGTLESARRRGAASVVVHACLIEAHRQGAHAAVLGTSFELARKGGLYHRLGFETVGLEHSWLLGDFDRLELPT